MKFYSPIHSPLYASPMDFPCLQVCSLRWQPLSYWTPSAPHTGPPCLESLGQWNLQSTQYARMYWSTMHVRFLRQTTLLHPTEIKQIILSFKPTNRVQLEVCRCETNWTAVLCRVKVPLKEAMALLFRSWICKREVPGSNPPPCHLLIRWSRNTTLHLSRIS